MNDHLLLLRNLYFSASGKYQKFRVRFEKAVQTGKFRKLSKRKQSSLISRLKKLYARLKSLQTQLRIAGASAVFALTLSINDDVQAQGSLGPFVRNDATNPFPPPADFNEPRPAIVDIDNDGDKDVFVGNVDGSISFFQNVSPTGSVTRFTEVTGSANPFNGVNKGNHAALAFADVDGDGDFDMLLGNIYGDTFFFRNNNSSFQEQTGINNPFDGITGTNSKYGTSQAIPVFVNLDGDSDVDLYIGSSYRYDMYGPHPAVQYFENNAGVFTNTPNFLASELGYQYNVKLAFADIDGDLDLDAFVGSSNSYIRTFRQDSELTFTQVYAGANPFNNFYFSNFTSPAVGDMDNDGDLDVLVGNGNYGPYFGPDKSNIRYFENGGGFLLQDHTDLNISPFGGVDVGHEAAPVFVDLDIDGDLDAVIGSKYSTPADLFVFINNNGVFTADPDHPIVAAVDELDMFKEDVIPVFVDIDGDQDQDFFVCLGRRIEFFRNSGGSLIHETTLFPSVSYGSAREISLAFVDVDNDGDFDALMGNTTSEYAVIEYFINQGTATTPNFVEATPPSPFNSLQLSNDANLNLSSVDLDNDGDTDLAVTETYYNGWYGDSNAARTWFYENNGDGTFSESENPLIIELTPYSFTSFTDYDGDGDLDAFVGNGETFDFEQNGRVFYYENTNPPPVTTVITTILNVIGGQATILDPLLTITDPDNDNIAQATVTISDYVAGAEELIFNSALLNGTNVTGEFADETGILTFIGVESIDFYQNLLRTVAINFTGDVPNARKSKAASALSLLQTVTFQVRDTDFTLTTVSVVSLNIVPGDELTIYNAVSPNKGDEFNSFMRIAAIETLSPNNTVTIYNRWGDVVFEVKDYNNSDPAKRFEGVNKNGKDLPSGTYFYKIEITGKTITGYLSLKR